MYEQKLLANLNTIVTAGSGYWDEQEPTQGHLQLTGMLEVQSFADAHKLHSRLHNLIRDDNEPSWTQSLSVAALDNAIATREGYYLGGTHFGEVDIYNESWHGETTPGSYWQKYGASGIAKIYRDSTLANPATKAFVNDYSVLQGSSNSFGRHIDSINAAGYGTVVGGIGLQYYTGSPDPNAPSVIKYALENMNVRGLPTVLTEFGTFAGTSPSSSATLLDQTIRMMFGNPTSTGFVIWDWTNDGSGFATGSALYDVNGSTWTLTQSGQKWQSLLGTWTTQLTSIVGADGEISFTGYYGDYQLTAGNQVYNFTLTKGVSNYSLVPGDFNGDGAVNGADYVVWRKTDGTQAGYNLWRAHFGQTAGSGVALRSAEPLSAVPEPAALMLLLLTTAGISIGQRGKVQPVSKLVGI
jgi:hypothetical protein